MNEIYKFWMVFAEAGTSPSVVHHVKSDAEKEAIRIAEKTGKRTFVLESICGYQIPKPEVVMFETSAHAPQEQRDSQ